MEFLFFIGFPLITFFLGLTAGYIYGNTSAVEKLRPAREDLNRRIDREVLNLNQRVDQDVRNLCDFLTDLEREVDNLDVPMIVQENLNKAGASKNKSKRGIRSKSGK